MWQSTRFLLAKFPWLFKAFSVIPSFIKNILLYIIKTFLKWLRVRVFARLSHPPPKHLRKCALLSFSPETTGAAGAVICLLSEQQNKPKVMNRGAGRRGRVYRLTAIVWGPPIYFTHLPMEVTRFVLTKKSRMKLSSLCLSPTTDNTFVTRRPPLLLEGVL